MVRSIELNLASRPFRNNMLLWFGHSSLAAAVIAFTAWNTLTFLETGRKLRELRNSVGSLESRLNDVEVRERRVQAEIGKHDLKYLATQTARANDVIARRALSWTRLFNLLEKVLPYEVKMVSIRPVFGNPNPGQVLLLAAGPPAEVVPVSVEGSSKDLNAFLDFERALIVDAHFDRVEPERSIHAKNGEIVFGLSFLYYPAGQSHKQGSAPAVAEVPVPSENEAADEPEGSDENAGAETVSPKQLKLGASPLPQVPPQGTRAVPPPAGSTVPARKYRRPKHDVPTAPLRRRPDGWQPPKKGDAPQGKHKEK